jgi:ribonuclease P protein component
MRRGRNLTRSGLIYPQDHPQVFPGFILTNRALDDLIARFSGRKNLDHEAHLSTFRRSPQAYARFPRPYGYQGRPQGHCRSPCQGPSSSGRLKTAWSIVFGAETAADVMQPSPDTTRSGPSALGPTLWRLLPVYRLRKTDEFSSVFAFRRTIRGDWFVAHYRPNGGPSARLGVVVAKKLVRRAVKRNLLKRLAREHFRLHRATLPACDVIVRLTARVDGASRAQLRRDIAKVFDRLPR